MCFLLTVLQASFTNLQYTVAYIESLYVIIHVCITLTNVVTKNSVIFLSTQLLLISKFKSMAILVNKGLRYEATEEKAHRLSCIFSLACCSLWFYAAVINPVRLWIQQRNCLCVREVHIHYTRDCVCTCTFIVCTYTLIACVHTR